MVTPFSTSPYPVFNISLAWKHSLNHSTTYQRKRSFFFLREAWESEHCYAIAKIPFISRSCSSLRQRLVILLEYYRYSPFLYRSTGCKFIRILRSARDPLWVISKACSVVAQCTSYQGEALTMGHILKTFYFAIIIILRFISDLAAFPRPESRSQIRAAALETAMYWVDQTLYRCINRVFTISGLELSLRHPALACVFCCSAVSIS